ncbi:hypothetical protein [Streptomyces sp. NPDC047928]|uniref:hypothetical protein n=1 Tax=unclassified Streptomyces TaxID=2593676 RepID=UPI0037233096
MDLESVAGELYALRPDAFTGARNQRAAEAREAGDRALADAVQGLRRPTLAAWASNLLVRDRPDEARSLVALGESLRRAHRDLDGERLRELARRQHAVVTALARQARELAADAGQPVGEGVQHEVEATLHAVIADPRAAEEWTAGRLAKPLTPPVGFDAAGIDASALAARPRRRPAESDGAAEPAAEPARRKKAGRGKEVKKAEEAQKAEEADEADRAARRAVGADRAREAAREEAANAEREAEAREEDLRRADSDRERAEGELREAERRASELAERLERAEEVRRDRAEAARAARERAQDAARAAHRARRRAQDAAARTGSARPGSSSTR